jgi:DNA-binding LacI/PurR family transcriptional regulator
MGPRSATISDVARAAGVSKTTASEALSGNPRTTVSQQTREKVCEVARTIGYRKSGLAFALSTGRTYTIGLICEAKSDAERTNRISVYQKDILLAVARAASRVGLRVTVLFAHADAGATLAEVQDGRVDGVILASIPDAPLSSRLYASGFPVVTIGSGSPERRIHPDNRGGVRLAVQHLVELGHRTIAYVGYESAVTPTWTEQERLSGYREAMHEYGLTEQSYGQDNVNTLLAEWHSLSPGARPTAFVAYNDGVAVGLLRRARRRGIDVPRDVSVVGFDDVFSASECDPPLTTIENPLDEQAESAVNALQFLWRGEEPPPTLPVPTRLILRESTAKPTLSK